MHSSFDMACEKRAVEKFREVVKIFHRTDELSF
jgi:hypothetical protein